MYQVPRFLLEVIMNTTQRDRLAARAALLALARSAAGRPVSAAIIAQALTVRLASAAACSASLAIMRRNA